jgi:hypothetical protein
VSLSPGDGASAGRARCSAVAACVRGRRYDPCVARRGRAVRHSQQPASSPSPGRSSTYAGMMLAWATRGSSCEERRLRAFAHSAPCRAGRPTLEFSTTPQGQSNPLTLQVPPCPPLSRACTRQTSQSPRSSVFRPLDFVDGPLYLCFAQYLTLVVSAPYQARRWRRSRTRCRHAHRVFVVRTVVELGPNHSRSRLKKAASVNCIDSCDWSRVG